MKKQNQMSSLDIAVIINDLQQLKSYRIENVYADEAEKIFLFKLKGVGDLRNPLLLIEPGVRIHFTELDIDFPDHPLGKIMNLRSHLKGARISDISQIGFDRLIEIVLLKENNEARVYIEFFGRRSNLIVVSNEEKVIFAKWYKKMRDRDILPGQKFTLPTSKSISIFEIQDEKFLDTIKTVKDKNITVIRFLANEFTGGGILFEEILLMANIDKEISIDKISDNEINQIIEARNNLLNNIKSPNPVIYKNSSGDIINYAPFPYKLFDYDYEEFNSFSALLDEFFLSIQDQRSDNYYIQERKKERLQKILNEQQSSLKKFEERKKVYKIIGDLVYAHFAEIEELLTTISSAKKKNLPWEEIVSKLEQAKAKGMNSAKIFGGINTSTGKITLNLENKSIRVDYRKSVTNIADIQYKVSKKASRKIDPVIEEIEKTKKQLSEISSDLVAQSDVDITIIKKRRRNWYETYHWTITRNGYLVIGGKDVKSNEILAKRRLEKNDLFFHGDISGAPYTILKIENNTLTVTEDDLYQAAHIAGVFSSAWKAGYGSVDVYYVPADSVSFTAPSGEFIPKGGIMVRGKKTFIKNVRMELAIGIIFHEFYSSIIYGIEDEINKKCESYITIKPGDGKKGQIGKQVIKFFLNDHDLGSEKAKIKALDLNDIVQALPGLSQISNVHRRKKS